ncbi:outer membrane receptor protein involved in Fe transport [Novosphingobium chloroacetimidivorans]|uniref:Outer membrane receptor protein involved in Fe transport n=1 Tax=Novosphingobium chloroacetimidivorans TaxID=1428314 RepID=A0A7W7NU94_9SPHN|nr:TonB-dependent receptor [Novosphingobium chloroacetimidivorans]MBB4857288.1 outer membrane receptor protein involved in Fe transport [Novosphingobium chloroacetimidivorans]
MLHFPYPRTHRSVAAMLSSAMLTMAATPAFAQASPEAGPQPASPIIVIGRGLPDSPATPAYDVVTLDRGTIASSASGRIEDVLTSVAGFSQFRRSDSRSSNPSNQGATLRALGGNASSRALVLLDGVPVANPFFGYIPFSALAPDRLGRVRVTRGGGSGAFGSGAVSGSIELESGGPDSIGLLSGQVLVDQRGETQASLTAAPRLGQGFAVASVQWDRGQGFWTTPRDQRVPASARARYESWSAALRAVVPLTDTIEVQASALAYDDARTLRFDGADSTSSGQQASLRLVGRGDWAFDVLGYVQVQDFSNIVISATSFRKTLNQAKTPSTGYGGKAELRPPIGENHVLRLGADVRVSEGALYEEPFNAITGLRTAVRRAGGRNTDVGFYAEDDWTIGDLILTAGARADRWQVTDGFFRELDAAGRTTIDTRFADRAGWEGNFRGGAVWRASTALALRAAAYTGFRQPTLNELYRPFVVFPIATQANAALRNERLRGYEAGIELTPVPNVTLTATVFDNRLKDAIANVTLTPTTRQRRNVDAVHARGLELGARAALGTVSFDGSLSWTDAEVDASGTSAALDGKRPAQVPKLAATGTLAWAPREGWRLAATLRHTGAQFEDDLETDVLPAATTLDGVVQIPLTRAVSLLLRGENLFDESIVTRNQAGSIDLGIPRTLWAGVRVGLR